MLDEHDDFRRILSERADLAEDCDRLGAVTLRSGRTAGFTGQRVVRPESRGDGAHSGFEVWGSEDQEPEQRRH